MTDRSETSTRPTPAVVAHALGEHWQVLAAVLLLVVGGIGLLSTDYSEGGGTCTPGETEAIPQDLVADLESASRESGFPVRVLAAQIEAESNWKDDAESHAGAMGIAQFTQDTWDLWGQGGDPMDQHEAIAAQGRYMKYLRTELTELAGNDEDTVTRYALAGYNAGPNAVKQAHGIPDYPETRHYVDKIMDLQAAKYSTTCS